jgi:Family of unknown function (DUF5670)
MLWTIAVILLVLWVLGMLTSYTAGGWSISWWRSPSLSSSSSSSPSADPFEGRGEVHGVPG